MALLDDLLGLGYFPRELPPSFSTRELAARLLANADAWPARFGPGRAARMCTYSLAKPGGLRRKLSVPNPVPHIVLCEFLATRWKDLRHHTRASAVSLSKPVRDRRRRRAIVTALAIGEVPTVRAKSRSDARYIVSTDLSAFYPSLYTHSVPWALHGKRVAKFQRATSALWGNKLDRLLRIAQDEQTTGIPIGPDTSLVIAEVVLSAIDREVTHRIPGLRGLRYMDDFEFYFPGPSAAESGLAVLQEALLEFELRLNPYKTTVDQAPIGIEHEWVHALRNFAFSAGARPQARDLIRYFDLLTKCFRENGQDHVVKYGLSRLRGLQVDPRNWDLYQSLLAGAVVVEPGAVHAYVDILARCHRAGCVPTPGATERTLNLIIESSAQLGHHHEVAWSLWAILFWRLQLSDKAARAISRVENSFVALLALDAKQNGLIASGLGSAGWESRMTAPDLYDDQWLLSYEANVHGWLQSVGGGDHVASDPCFGHLKALGITFYTTSVGAAGTAVPVGFAAAYP
jgi:Reverse transcriptase (RNA-dependent DNA polymerase)